MNELAARVEAHWCRVQRPGAAPEPQLETGSRRALSIDPGARRLAAARALWAWTLGEYVLYLVASQAPMVLSREDIYRSVWGYDAARSIARYVFVRRIRKKLQAKIPCSVVSAHPLRLWLQV